MHVHVSLGNQLFAPDTLQHLQKTDAVVYMREDLYCEAEKLLNQLTEAA